MSSDLFKVINKLQSSIAGITSNSKDVQENYIFVAIKGTKFNGEEFIEDAINKGSKVIIVSDKYKLPKDFNNKINFIKVQDTRLALANLAADFYAKQPNKIAAITGTNGKTSTAHFSRILMELLGVKSASIGTIGIIDQKMQFEHDLKASMTSPEPAFLFKKLAEMKNKSIEFLAIEASSHGIDQKRMHGLKAKVAAFTSFSRDHLDYHNTMEDYLAAKIKLFTEIIQDKSYAVINADMEEYPAIESVCKKKNHIIFDYGFKGKYLKITSIKPRRSSQQINFSIGNKDYMFETDLIGEFQAYNLICAILIVHAFGHDINDILAHITKVTSVPGRLEKVQNNAKKLIYVDYAHTPDALEKALKVLRPYAIGKLWVLFGCGGDRDKGKRPLMGEIASKYADKIIITDDNPRSEKPESIRKEILSLCPGAIEIEGRDLAIKYAIENISNKDILLIAGKGHEKTQTIGDQIIAFDDVEISKTFLKVY